MKNGFELLLENLVGRYKNRIFMTDARIERSIGYSDFLELVEKSAEKLKKAGISAGDRVLLFMGNSIEFSADFYAITFLHAVAVPVNTNLKSEELEYIMDDTSAAGILVDDEFLERAEDAAKALGYVPQPEIFQQGINLITLNDHAVKDLTDTTAMLLYTSGTTGHPKGVILSFDNLLSKAADVIEMHQLTDQDVTLCMMPWFHINGLVITMISSFVCGEKMVIAGKFSVSKFWQYVEKYGATWFSGVPAMYSHLLARGIPEYGTHSTLRFARSASSALPGAVLHEFEEKTGIPVIESYGITEGAAPITCNPLPPRPRKVGSVGIPYGNRISIRRPDGSECETGEAGEVWICGANVTSGYYHKPQETEKSFTGEWFHSGDVGRLDEEGYLFLSGRIKELINRAGEKFSPIEVDEVLYRLPQVELAATVGVPDPVYSEVPVAFLKLKDGEVLDEQTVRDWCSERLASYKVPAEVHFVDSIPQGGNGKIQRLKLVAVYNEMKGNN